MVSKHQAIVLSSIKYGDSSLIAKFFTQEYGLTTVMCNGVRKAKNGKMGLFQPLALCEIILHKKPNQNMATLKEIKNTPPIIYLHNTPSIAPICFYLSGLLSQFVHEGNEDKELFDFAWKYSLNLEHKQPNMANIPLHFTCNVLKISGYLPYPDFDTKNNNVAMAEEDQLNAALIKACVDHGIDQICDTKIDTQTRKACLEYLVNSASRTLQNNKLKEVYEQVKMLYS